MPKKVILTKELQRMIDVCLNKKMSVREIDREIGGYHGWLRNLCKTSKKKIKYERSLVDDV